MSKGNSPVLSKLGPKVKNGSWEGTLFWAWVRIRVRTWLSPWVPSVVGQLRSGTCFFLARSLSVLDLLRSHPQA